MTSPHLGKWCVDAPYHDLARRFIALEKKMVAESGADSAQLAAWTQERLCSPLLDIREHTIFEAASAPH